jgi:hypothetical protein
MALASATALVVLLSGNVAAYKLDRDDGSGAPSSPCHLDPGLVLDQHLVAKLGTTAGCEVIAFG